MKTTRLIGVFCLTSTLAFAQAPNDEERPPQPGVEEIDEGELQAPEQRAQPPEDTMQQTQRAFGSISAAQEALQKNDVETARSELSNARDVLDELYGDSQGSDAMEAVDQAESSIASGEEGVDFAPLLSTVQARNVYMDPKVVAAVQNAQKHHEQGHPDQSLESLRLARSELVADLALLPVDAAYARVVAAQALLDEENVEDAQRLLEGTPVVFSELRVRAPLVPVRFNLRAAAAAADVKDFPNAQRFINTAFTQIQQVQRSAQGDLARQLKPIADQLQKIQVGVQSGRQVKGQALRSLAERTKAVGAGTQVSPNQPRG